jgi:hypothetical protein
MNAILTVLEGSTSPPQVLIEAFIVEANKDVARVGRAVGQCLSGSPEGDRRGF